MERSAAYVLLAGLCIGAAFPRLVSAGVDSPPVPQQGEPVIVTPTQDPVWDTLTIKDDIPTMLVRVPKDRRFVLTDIWLLSMDDEHTPPEISDRIWLENRRDGQNFIVFDSKVAEIPLPMQWQTGVAFHSETEVWMLWDFGTERRRLRRVHYTGYFEDMPARGSSR